MIQGRPAAAAARLREAVCLAYIHAPDRLFQSLARLSQAGRRLRTDRQTDRQPAPLEEAEVRQRCHSNGRRRRGLRLLRRLETAP